MTDAPDTAPPPGWEGLLAPGERILWQGRPDARVLWADLLSIQSAMGLVFFGFALFWINMASSMGMPSNAPAVFRFFPLFGIPFALMGLHMLIGRVLWDAWRRSRTHYTLSSSTAFIATDLLGQRRLDSYRIGADSRLGLDDGDPGSVWFAEKVTRHAASRDADGTYRPAYTARTRVGFRRIAEARHVHGLIRGIQRRLREADGSGRWTES